MTRPYEDGRDCDPGAIPVWQFYDRGGAYLTEPDGLHTVLWACNEWAALDELWCSLMARGWTARECDDLVAGVTPYRVGTAPSTVRR